MCVCGVCVFGCVTAYVDFNLFELLTSKHKMKFEFSDVQVKGVRKFGENVRTVCMTVCECAHSHINKRTSGIEEE